MPHVGIWQGFQNSPKRWMLVNVVVNIQGRLIMSVFSIKGLDSEGPNSVASVQLGRVVFYAVSVVQQSG